MNLVIHLFIHLLIYSLQPLFQGARVTVANKRDVVLTLLELSV